MVTTTTSFREASLRAEKTSNCVTCGKRRKRAKTFWQTVNPFNKKADGTVKSLFDIIEENKANAYAWKEKPIDCCNE